MCVCTCTCVFLTKELKEFTSNLNGYLWGYMHSNGRHLKENSRYIDIRII